METNANPMVADLLERLAIETQQAITYRESDQDEDKLPLRTQSLGIFSKNGSSVFTADEFKEYGLTPKETETLQTITGKLRKAFVAKHGEVTGFDSKRGTAIVASLKSFQSMADLGTFDLSPADLAAIKEGTDAWYANAPLRGKAGAKAKAEREAKAKAAETA